jgi:hypothetical protein
MSDIQAPDASATLVPGGPDGGGTKVVDREMTIK